MTSAALTEIERRVQARALTCVGAFHPERDEDLGQTLLLLGPNEPDFWPVFTQSAEYQDGAAHPLDRWSRRVISALATEIGATAHFPFGGPPYAPFLQWAKRSGEAWSSPAGPLVHARAGMMISYRGALALPQRLDLADLPLEPPCLTCADKPCLTACPVSALSEDSGYDVQACRAWLNTGPDCMSFGCAARRACPVSQQFPRRPEQSAFHMAAFHPRPNSP